MKPRRIVLASANSGKLREVAALLAPRAITVEPLSAFDAGRVEETGSTFIENAILKARHACAASGLAALADDSGLVVPALDGAPGIHSARFAGSRASDAQNVQKLLSVMAGVPEPERRARFVCTVVYLRHCEDPCPEIGEGAGRGGSCMGRAASTDSGTTRSFSQRSAAAPRRSSSRRRRTN